MYQSDSKENLLWKGTRKESKGGNHSPKEKGGHRESSH